MMHGAHIGEPTIGHDPRPDAKGEYLFEGVLPRTGLAFVLGAPNVGKSLFVVWMAACLATGRPLFEANAEQRQRYGEEFAQPLESGAVLYLSAEDADIFPKRAEAALRNIEASGMSAVSMLPGGKLPIICLSVAGLSDDSNAVLIERKVRSLIEDLERKGFPMRVVVFDTLTAAFRIDDENDNSKMQKVMRALREYGRRFDSLVVVVTHPKKGGRRSVGQVRGASSMTASADVILEILKPAGRGSTNARSVKVAKIRDGACEGEKFNFEIGRFAEQAAIHPVLKEARNSHTDKRSGDALTAKHIELLHDMEAWSAVYGAPVGGNGGHLIYGITLERMVQRQFEADYSGNRRADEAEAKRAKDRIRKQVGRDGLFKLAELGLLERYEESAKLCFRPATDWDAMTDGVAALAPGAGYRSAATHQRERINYLYAYDERDGDAMSRPLFRALHQLALRISPPPDLHNVQS